MKQSEIKHAYLLSEVIGKYVELKRKGRECWACCPFHGEKTESMIIQDERKSWHCYGCGKHGDVVDFVQQMNECGVMEACDIITGNKEWKPSANKLPIVNDIYDGMVSVQPEEKELPQVNCWFRVWNPKPNQASPDGRYANYKPVMVHPYRTVDGVLVGCTVRLNLPDRKVVAMLRMIVKDGHRTWSHFPFEKPRSLYRAETLRGSTGVVLVVEGEKCADIAARYLGGTIITWSGGTNAAKLTDWSPLKDRDVLLWPDADREGLDAMLGKADAEKPVAGVKELIMAAGARGVKCLGWDNSKPKGWDIADAVLHDKMTRDQIIEYMKYRLNEYAGDNSHG